MKHLFFLLAFLVCAIEAAKFKFNLHDSAFLDIRTESASYATVFVVCKLHFEY
jgi:hypothetical protein